MQTETADRRPFYAKLEPILNLPPGTIDGDQALSAFPNWDSLAIIEFLTMASFEYDREIEPTDLDACETVDDLANVVFAGRSALVK